MEEHLKRAIENQARELAGPTHMEQHIILLRLTELLENMPDLSIQPKLDAVSQQRKWISEVGALLSRISSEKKIAFKTAMTFSNKDWNNSIQAVIGAALDASEELKLNLELSGRTEIGTAYSPGEVYKFFTDLKSIVNSSTSSLFIIDPYFNGEAFDNYLSSVPANVNIRIFANNYSKEVLAYIRKHRTQFGSNIQLKSSSDLHDRLVFVDNDDCWIMGGSIKDAGKKPTYLIPIIQGLTKEKHNIYEKIWNQSKLLE